MATTKTAGTRKPRKSRLEAEHDYIRRNWVAGESLLSIAEMLMARGCQTSYENLRKWTNREVAANRFPPRSPSGLGRPPKKPPLKNSLGILPPADLPKEAKIDIPAMLGLLFKIPFIPIELAQEAMRQLGIPQDADGEADFIAYARGIGRDRLSRFGDGDYILLTICLRDWRDYEVGENEWIEVILRESAKLKRDMITAASAEK